MSYRLTEVECSDDSCISREQNVPGHGKRVRNDCADRIGSRKLSFCDYFNSTYDFKNGTKIPSTFNKCICNDDLCNESLAKAEDYVKDNEGIKCYDFEYTTQSKTNEYVTGIKVRVTWLLNSSQTIHFQDESDKYCDDRVKTCISERQITEYAGGLHEYHNKWKCGLPNVTNCDGEVLYIIIYNQLLMSQRKLLITYFRKCVLISR